MADENWTPKKVIDPAKDPRDHALGCPFSYAPFSPFCGCRPIEEPEVQIGTPDAPPPTNRGKNDV